MTGTQQFVLWIIVAVLSGIAIADIADSIQKVKVAKYTGKQEPEPKQIDYELPDKKL